MGELQKTVIYFIIIIIIFIWSSVNSFTKRDESLSNA